MTEVKKLTFEITGIEKSDDEEGERIPARYLTKPFTYSDEGSLWWISQIFIQYKKIDDLQAFQVGEEIIMEVIKENFERGSSISVSSPLNKFVLLSDSHGNEIMQVREGNIDEFAEGLGRMFGCELHELVIVNKEAGGDNSWKIIQNREKEKVMENSQDLITQEQDKKNSLEGLKNENEKLRKQFIEISNIVMPNITFDFTNLKSEIKKLKIERSSSQLQSKKNELKQLKTTIKNKLNEESKELLEILLEAQLEVNQNNNSFAQKQLARAKKSLSKKLTKEEIQTLLNIQEEIIKLEKQLENLQE